MGNNWRLIIDSELSGVKNMARDCALLANSSQKNFSPTLRFYKWKPATLTIGYFQDPNQELHLSQCKDDNVPVIRRVTGGGAVFHQYEITYSFIIPLNYAFSKLSILDSYKKICSPIIETLKSYSLNASFSGINDIIVDQQKISGNAQTRRMGGILQHGTILLNIDAEKMFSYLNISSEKSNGKKNSPGTSRVTSLKNLLSIDVLDHNFYLNFCSKVTSLMEKEFSTTFKEGSFNDKEQELSNMFADELFSKELWNYSRSKSNNTILNLNS